MSDMVTVQYLDVAGRGRGGVIELKVPRVLARVLAQTKGKIERSDRKWLRARHLEAPEIITGTARRQPCPEGATSWQGPKLNIRLFIGDALTWPVAALADGTCGCCHDAELPSFAACLWCGRTGVDDKIEPCTARERPKPYVPDEDLAGGVGPATPRAGKVVETRPARRKKRKGK